MRNNIERTAWIILLTAFGIFCLLSLLIPASIRWYIINATDTFSTEVTSVRGTVVIGNPAAGLSSSLTDGNTTTAEENFIISTDTTSQAILTFSDDSSLTMYSDTTIVLRETRTPRFGWSPNPTQILIEVQKGRVRATSSLSRTALNFDLSTPQARIELNEGSFSIETNETETQVTTRLGQANVMSDGSVVMLKQGERALVSENQAPSPPLPAAQNLLKDSDFSPASLNNSWETYERNFSEGGVLTTAQVVTFQDRSVLALRSEGQDNVHTEVGVSQQVNKDVRDFQSLRIFAEVRLVRQSLPGGGQQGSEFPIMLRLDYKDADNNDRQWYHGFYYSPKPDNYILYDEPFNSSERIARFIWYPYESDNLLTSLGPAKPVFVKSITIYASGWIYEAMVANVSLLAQE
ncbi:MAG: FecR domain-containing protein [Anaerolineales bacterium]|nr:FecR domain-containing protein [Anaerolineales bacterium]